MFIVTGGAGLIGSLTVWKLNACGIDDILVVDHLGTSDKWKNLAPLRFADYLEKDAFRETLRRGALDGKKIDGIFHLGACSSTTERDASYLVDNNFVYTTELAHFAVGHRIRMVYASSCATYGDGSQGYRDDESAIEKLRPLNMYGYSKQLFDLWAKRRGYFDLLTGCKFSNIYGPNEEHKNEMRSVVLRAYEEITATGRMRLFRSYRPEYADGEQKRDFLYVKDAVNMLWFLFNSPRGTGLFNVGSGKAETWNHLVTAVFRALGKTPAIEYIDMPEHLRDRYQYYTCADMTKLRERGFDEAVFTLDEAVADYVGKYLTTGKRPGDE
ncbi:MAG: ADP-glyceromanno-heptose 6-epimerase [Victivallaceae bacterium]|nr:ADP-glyceromanno-heptose 6-epimerase [Victivallaceae bacterium]